MALLLALYLIIATAIPSTAADNTQSSATTSIKADVMYWEDQELIVKEFSGHEMRLVLTPDTKIEGVVAGRLKTGDKIVAQITEDKRALSITVQVPDAANSNAPAGRR